MLIATVSEEVADGEFVVRQHRDVWQPQKVNKNTILPLFLVSHGLSNRLPRDELDEVDVGDSAEASRCVLRLQVRD